MAAAKKAGKKAGKKKAPAKKPTAAAAEKPKRKAKKKSSGSGAKPRAHKLTVPELVTLAHRVAHSRDKELLEQIGVAVDLAKLTAAKLAAARGCVERLTADKVDVRVRAAQDLADVFHGRAVRRKRRAA